MKLEMEAPVSHSRIATGQSRGTEVVSRTPQQRPVAPDPVRASNDATAPADQVQDEAATSTGARQPAGSFGAPTFVPRLSRDLHWNFFTSEPARRTAEHTPADDWTQLTDAFGIRSPLRSAIVLLGLYIAMYLAVAGVLYVLASRDAAADLAAGHSSASLSFATAFDRRAVEGSSASGVAEPIDSSRECATSKAIDSECIYN